MGNLLDQLQDKAAASGVELDERRASYAREAAIQKVNRVGGRIKKLKDGAVANVKNATRLPRAVAKIAADPDHAKVKYDVERTIHPPKTAAKKALLPPKVKKGKKGESYKGSETDQTKVRIARHAKRHGVASAIKYARKLGSEAGSKAIRGWMLDRDRRAIGLKNIRKDAKSKGRIYQQLTGYNSIPDETRQRSKQRTRDDSKDWGAGYHPWTDSRKISRKTLRRTILKNPQHPEHQEVKRQWAARQKNEELEESTLDTQFKVRCGEIHADVLEKLKDGGDWHVDSSMIELLKSDNHQKTRSTMKEWLAVKVKVPSDKPNGQPKMKTRKLILAQGKHKVSKAQLKVHRDVSAAYTLEYHKIFTSLQDGKKVSEATEEELLEAGIDESAGQITMAMVVAALAGLNIAARKMQLRDDQREAIADELMKKWLSKPVRVPSERAHKGYVTMTRAKLLSKYKKNTWKAPRVYDTVSGARDRMRQQAYAAIRGWKLSTEKAKAELGRQQAEKGQRHSQGIKKKEGASAELERWKRTKVEYRNPNTKSGRSKSMRGSILKNKKHPMYQSVSRAYARMKKRLGYDPDAEKEEPEFRRRQRKIKLNKRIQDGRRFRRELRKMQKS